MIRTSRTSIERNRKPSENVQLRSKYLVTEIFYNTLNLLKLKGPFLRNKNIKKDIISTLDF